MLNFFGYINLTPHYTAVTDFNEKFTEFLTRCGDSVAPMPCIQGNYEGGKSSVVWSCDDLSPVRNYLMSVPSEYEGKPPLGIPLPSRNAFVAGCIHGNVQNQEELKDSVGITDQSNDYNYLLAPKLLARLNSSDAELLDSEDNTKSYRERVNSRIYSVIKGQYSSHLAYLSSKTSFVLMSKDVHSVDTFRSSLKVWLLSYKGLILVLWSTDGEFANLFESFMEEHYSKDSYLLFVSPIILSLEGVLVIHPNFIVSKLRKWKSTYKNKGGTLLAFGNLKKYLLRSIEK